MNHYERVMAAINHQPVDRHPTDIWCVDEVRERLMAYCGVSEWIGVYDALDIDGIIGVAPPYVGPPLPDLGEDLRQDAWGMVYRRQEYLNGVYWEQVGYPLSQAQAISDLDAYRWPDPEWYDYAALPDLCAQYEGRVVRVGYTAVFYYHNKLRGLELSLMDPALEPRFAHHLIRRLADFFYEYHGRCYEAAGRTMQCTQVTDDFGSQTGLLISKRTFEEFYRSWIQRAIDQAKSFGIKVFHHDDGAIYPLISDLAQMRIDILNPIQWRCKGMERVALKRDFGDKVIFHGGVDNQYTLAFGSVPEVRQEVMDNLRILGAGGGYILAPCHNIQAVSPAENIVAMYETGYEYGWT